MGQVSQRAANTLIDSCCVAGREVGLFTGVSATMGGINRAVDEHQEFGDGGGWRARCRGMLGRGKAGGCSSAARRDKLLGNE